MERLRGSLQNRERNAARWEHRMARAAAVMGFVALLDVVGDEYQIRSDIDRAFPNLPSAENLAWARQRLDDYNNLNARVEIYRAKGSERMLDPNEFVRLDAYREMANSGAKILVDEDNRQQLTTRLHDENNPKRLAESIIAATGIILFARSLSKRPERFEQRPLTDEELHSLHGTIQSLHSQKTEDYDRSKRAWRRKVREVFDVQLSLAQEMQLTGVESQIFVSFFSSRLGKRLIEQTEQQIDYATKLGLGSDSDISRAEAALRKAKRVVLPDTEERMCELIEENVQGFAAAIQKVAAENPDIPVHNLISERETRRWLVVTAQAGIILADALWGQPPSPVTYIRDLITRHSQEIEREGAIEIEYIAA